MRAVPRHLLAFACWLVPRLRIFIFCRQYLAVLADIEYRYGDLIGIRKRYWLAALELGPRQSPVYASVTIEVELPGSTVDFRHRTAANREQWRHEMIGIVTHGV